MLAMSLVAGVDEAGRGPLAGPLVVAAVILDPARPIAGLADSKVLAAERREVLAPLIRQRALAWSLVVVEVAEIDRLNIFHATMTGMTRSVNGLSGFNQRRRAQCWLTVLRLASKNVAS